MSANASGSNCISGIIFGLMLGLMSVGMNLVYGTTGLQSFSHGEQVTLGGLMAYVGTQMLHMPLIASAIFAIVIGALTGFIQNEIVWGRYADATSAPCSR